MTVEVRIFMEKISELSGVPLGCRRYSQENKWSPRYDTLQALEKAFKSRRQVKERMPKMTVEEMKRQKRMLDIHMTRLLNFRECLFGTVQKIFSGVTESPRYDTLQALEKAFKSQEGDRIEEAAAMYRARQQGNYIIEDYYALPEDRRAELIDGIIYDMSSPTSVHQLIGAEIWEQLKSYIRNSKGKCVPMLAPLDVQLDCDDRTMVQPDVLVVCDRERIHMNCVYGAPDFIVEIMSKTTRKKDSILKLNKYMNAGVREYWMVDPESRKVVVYDFAHEEYPVIYGGEDKVPVGIFDGECKVDFGEIYEYMNFLYE